MYPPRSEKYRNRQQAKQRRYSRFWLTLNVSLIIAIIALGAYYYVEELTAPNMEGGQDQAPVQYPADRKGDLPNNHDELSRADAGNLDSDGGPAAPGVDPEGGGAGMDADSGQPPSDEDGPFAPGTHQEPAEMLHLHFAGDTIFSGSIESKLEKEGYHYPYKHIRELFEGDDLSVLNLETPVTDRGTPAEDKSFVFKAPPKALAPMHKAGVDVVNLANNHTLDQGVEGLLDTMKHLQDNHIEYFGAGKNKQEAYAPLYLERKGITIALCGFSRVIPQSDWAAGKNKAGLAIAYDSAEAVKAVQAARQHADLVIVVTHWGKERTTELEKHQTSLAHAFIDAGADLVVGGHPHVLQALERYKGKWIIYSTGNFIFTKSSAPDTWDTAVFEAKCTKDGDCEMKLLPFRTEIGQPVPLQGEEGAQVLRKVERLSSNIVIDASGAVRSLIEG